MLTKFASASVLDVIEVPRGANAKTLRKAAHRVGFEYEPRPGYLYIRSRAISSRCNDNFDEFPAEEIEKSYMTFVGKPVFVNHNNDNHRRARGVVIDAALHRDINPDGTPDTWTEVLMEVDAVRFPKLAKAILAKHIDRTSMGTDVAFSICSACNNKATTPLEYCQHIPRMKGQMIYKDDGHGRKIGTLIREKCYGLKFFENSLLVEEPADPTAYFLGVDDYSKTASQKTAEWNYASHPEPVTHHPIGKRPVRPLQAGDHVVGTDGVTRHKIEADSPSLLKFEGRPPMHRGPIEGDDSGSIVGITHEDKADMEVGSPEERAFLTSNPTGPSKWSSKTASPVQEKWHPNTAPFAKDDVRDALSNSVPMKFEDAADTTFEREHNSDLALTKGDHKTRPFGDGDGAIHSLNSIHAFFKQAELSPISDCKSCGTKKGAHCAEGCEGTRLYKHAEKVRHSSTEVAKAHVEGAAAANGHTMGPWEQNTSGSHQAHCKNCGRSAGVDKEDDGHMTYGSVGHSKCDAPSNHSVSEDATHHAQLVLENDSNDYHNIHAIVNTSKHPVETSHALGQYMRSLPKDHPLHEELKGVGATHEDVDTDKWAHELHHERDLNPGDIHAPEGDYHLSSRALKARRLAMQFEAIGETIAPKDVSTLRDEECPVCAEKDAYDGDECQVCGFIQPPKMFQDPDLDMAKQIDLRKDQTEGFDPRDPNSDPQGANQVPQQGSDDPNAVDAQGMPNEVPGSAQPGTDQVMPGQGSPGQPMLPGQAPLAPASPDLLDQEGNVLPSQSGVPPVGLPYQGPEGVQGDSISQPQVGPDGQPLVGPNGMPMSPMYPDQQRGDSSELGKTDVSVFGTEPGLPLLDGSDPAVKMQFGTGDSIEQAAPSEPPAQPAPPGVQGDTMPTTDIYGQPLGPDGAIPPDEVQQYQQMQSGPMDPSDLPENGNQMASDGGAGGGGETSPFAPDGQSNDPSQEGDSSMQLDCSFCGETFDATPPSSITTDQPQGDNGPDGTVAGDVCPICGQGVLEPVTTDPAEADGGAAGAGAGNNAGGGGDLLEGRSETTPPGKNKLT